MQDADSTNSGRERRRYLRLPLQLEAMLALGPRPAIACVVKDFCVAGMFIQIDMRQLRFVQPQTPAVVYFALRLEDRRQDFQMALTVCRVTSNGLGVAFKAPDPKVIGLLHNLAQATPAATDVKPGESLADTQRRFAPEFGRALPGLTELAERSAAHIAIEFTRLAGDALFIGARDARTNREQSKFTDAQVQLRRRADEIKEHVPQLMTKAVTTLNNPLRTKSPKGGAELSNLSLVDKDEFEEFLSVSEVVSDLEAKFKKPLFELNQRFSFLARREIDDDSNPLAPALICNAFAEAMKGVSFDRQISDVVYKTLRRTIEPELERLYDEANTLLIETGILPKIDHDAKLGVRRTPNDSRAPTSAPNPLEASKAGVKGTTPPANLADTMNRLSYTQPRYPAVGGPLASGSPRAPGVAQSPLPAGGAGANYPSAPAVSPAGPGYSAVSGPPTSGSWGAPPVSVGSGIPGAEMRAGTAFAPGRVQAGNFGATGPQMVGSGIGLDSTFSGFGFGPAVSMMPNFEQAFSTAQAQLALRRQVNPVAAPDNAPRGSYSMGQIADGLSDLQQYLTGTVEPELLTSDNIKSRIGEALAARGVEARGLGQTESDAIEIIVNLFQALLRDSMVADFAKGNLKRLQGSVHKAALLDAEFLASTQHPLRQLVNRVSMLQLDPGASGQRVADRVREMVDGVNLSFDRNLPPLDPVLGELDSVLSEQRGAYARNIQAVVAACEDQQRVLRERRDRSGTSSGESTQPQPVAPPELTRWIARAKALRVGDRVLMNATSKAPYPVSLVWVGDDYNPFVLADTAGQKSASLTLQQVAMYLRRGIIKPLTGEGDNAFDRALFGVVNRIHEEVAGHAMHDSLTGLSNRKTFLQTIEPLLKQTGPLNTGAVLGQLSLENLKSINDQFGIDTGDRLIKSLSDELKNVFDKKPVHLGRLGGGEWGVFWQRGGLQSAYREMQALIEKIAAASGVQAQPKFVAGLTAIEDELVSVEQLMAAVGDACGLARTTPDKPIYVAGADNKFRKQIEQMMSYVSKAIERERLALLFNEVRGITRQALPAARVVVSAEDRNGKLVPPALFTQAAIATAHAYTVDLWTLRGTLKWMTAHAENLERFSAFIVPLSRAALDKDDIANVIVGELMQTSVPPSRVCFEIDDKDAFAKLNETADLINTLREFGCQFILAEFGGGQSNYEYLKELAVNFVTIQSSFVADARQDPKDLAMAKSINELAHFMGKLTVGKINAEAGLLEVLREIGVDFVHDASRSTRLLLEADG